MTAFVPLSESSKNFKKPALVEPFFKSAPVLITGVVSVGVVNVLFVNVCVAVFRVASKPPAVEPSCILRLSVCVSILISPAAPVNASFWAVVPLLNFNTVGIYILLYLFIIVLLSFLRECS